MSALLKSSLCDGLLCEFLSYSQVLYTILEGPLQDSHLEIVPCVSQ